MFLCASNSSKKRKKHITSIFHGSNKHRSASCAKAGKKETVRRESNTLLLLSKWSQLLSCCSYGTPLTDPWGIWRRPACTPTNPHTHTGPSLVHFVSFVKLVHSLWPCLFIRRVAAYFSPFPVLVLLIGGYTLPNADILWSSQIITFTSLICSMWWTPPPNRNTQITENK